MSNRRKKFTQLSEELNSFRECLQEENIQKWYEMTRKIFYISGGNETVPFPVSDHLESQDPIYLVTQFYIAKNKNRDNENKFCLKRNTKIFDEIHLLNERIYTREELGLTEEEMENVKQFNIGKRMYFSDWLSHSKNISGFSVLANTDIFFDNSIYNLKKSILPYYKCCESLLRREYSRESNLKNCKFNEGFYKHGQSQDCWIIHTNFIPEKIENFNFNMGVLGCDTHFNHMMKQEGYLVFDSCFKLKIYHYHTSMVRDPNNTVPIRPNYHLAAGGKEEITYHTDFGIIS